MKKSTWVLVSIACLVLVPFVSLVVMAEEPVARGNGDVNGDGRLDASDVVFTLQFLYGGGRPPVRIPRATPSRKPTVVFLVRHAEDNKTLPVPDLTEEGIARALLLAQVFAKARITHIFSSHKLRTFLTVEPTALDHGMTVEQHPPLGSVLPSGEVVSEGTSTDLSIDPTIQAIRSVPTGSAVLVAGHSSTLFAIMAGLGVRVGTEEDPCEDGDTSCLPCTDKSCFPKEFDNLWTVTLGATPPAPGAMVRLDYGEPCPQLQAN